MSWELILLVWRETSEQKLLILILILFIVSFFIYHGRYKGRVFPLSFDFNGRRHEDKGVKILVDELNRIEIRVLQLESELRKHLDLNSQKDSELTKLLSQQILLLSEVKSQLKDLKDPLIAVVQLAMRTSR
jgi:hypothetical protein